jgi:hypothetical protein
MGKGRDRRKKNKLRADKRSDKKVSNKNKKSKQA